MIRVTSEDISRFPDQAAYKINEMQGQIDSILEILAKHNLT